MADNNKPNVNQNLFKPFYISEEIPSFIPVDSWVPTNDEDKIFKHVKGSIILPVSEYYGISDNAVLDNFILNSKKSYNSDNLREHLCHYINYFEKFYDTDRELLAVYYKIKYLIDYVNSYSKEDLSCDIYRYILTGNVFFKIRMMNRDNYSLNLTYKNNRNPEFQYFNSGILLMNLVKMRENVTLDFFIQTAMQIHIAVADQDLLNYVFYNDVCFLFFT